MQPYSLGGFVRPQVQDQWGRSPNDPAYGQPPEGATFQPDLQPNPSFNPPDGSGGPPMQAQPPMMQPPGVNTTPPMQGRFPVGPSVWGGSMSALGRPTWLGPPQQKMPGMTGGQSSGWGSVFGPLGGR